MTENSKGQPIPVVVVTGFLGSGKTTLLQRLLKLPQLGNTAVLMNELGEIGIDHHLVRQVSEDIVLLANGCLCCTVRNDLGVAMRGLLEQSAKGTFAAFERVVIETTGLADPVPIVHTLMTDPVVDKAFRLRSIVATVDAVNGERHLATHPESLKQVAVADRLIITKTDIADRCGLKALEARLRRLNPGAAIDEARSSRFDPELLVAGGDYEVAKKPAELRAWLNAEAYHASNGNHGHEHSNIKRHEGGIMATCMAFDETIDWTAFTIWLTMLLHSRGADVLRVKGLLNVQGHSGPVVIQGVQHIVSPPVHLASWPDSDRRSRLVFITRDIGCEALRGSLSVFNDAARTLASREQHGDYKPVRAGIGAQIGGRPYRRAGGLSWTK